MWNLCLWLGLCVCSIIRYRLMVVKVVSVLVLVSVVILFRWVILVSVVMSIVVNSVVVIGVLVCVLILDRLCGSRLLCDMIKKMWFCLYRKVSSMVGRVIIVVVLIYLVVFGLFSLCRISVNGLVFWLKMV